MSEQKDNIIECKTRIGGQFHILVESPDGSTREYEFDNLITNNGLNAIGRSILPTRLVVGSGNAPPAFTDTQLQSLIASSTVKSDSSEWTVVDTPASGETPYHVTYTYAFVFPKNTAIGIWAEIGAGWGTTNLFSRALIKDSNGTPITINVVADEQVTVTYRVRAYFPLSTAGTTNTLNVNGTEYTFTTRPSKSSGNNNSYSIFGTYTATNTQVYLYTNVTGLGQFTNSNIVGSFFQNVGVQPIVAPYVQDSFYNEWSFTLSISQGNTQSISGFRSTPWAYGLSEISAMISPPIVKTDTQTLSFTCRFYWDRY